MGEMAGQPTFFPEKIWMGSPAPCYLEILANHRIDPGLMILQKAKIHSIRSGKRWRPGMMIDFWVNMRTKNQFRFAPRVPVVSVQDIQIIYSDWYPVPGPPDCQDHYERYITVTIDDYHSIVPSDIIQANWGDEITFEQIPRKGTPSGGEEIFKLAVNDGFPDAISFFQWFDSDFEGQIIHWTDLKY